MANDNTAPLEDADGPGFFEDNWWFEKWLDFVGNFFTAWVDVIKNVWTKIITWDYTIKPQTAVDDIYKRFTEDPFDKKTVFSEREIELWNKSKEITWQDQTWGMVKGLWQADIKAKNVMGKDSVIGSWIQQKLKEGISEDAFNKTLTQIWMGISDKQKAIKDIQDTDPRFFAFRDFSNATLNKYLKKNNITQIENVEDFMNFSSQELAQLNPLAQAQIMQQQSGLAGVTKVLEDEILTEENRKNQYINSSIAEKEWKKWIDIYNEFNETQKKSFEWNKFIEYTWEVYQAATEEYDADMAKSWVMLGNLWTNYLNIRDANINSRATRKQFYLSVLADESNPANVGLAAKLKEADTAFNKFEAEKTRRLWEEMAKPENKWKSAAELTAAAEKAAWLSTDPEDRKLMRSQEQLITSRNASVNADEMVNRGKNLNPLAILDLVSYGTSAWQWIMDQAFDYNQEVPHYIQQEWRAFEKANEWNLSKFLSVLTHNPDALISLYGGMKWVGLLTKSVDNIISQLSKVDKALKIPVKIWFDSGYMRVIPSTMKGIQNSLVTGAVGDSVIDNQMQQAPTSANESFNYVTGLLFDPVPFALGKTLWLAGWAKSSFNEITFKYLHGDQYQAVADWTKAYNDLNPTLPKITEREARAALEWAAGIIWNVYSPEKVKSIFNEKGGIYRFLADNINQMNTNGIKNLVTGTGINIKINDIVGIADADYKSLNSLLEFNDEFVPTTEFQRLKAKVITDRIETVLGAQEKYLDGTIAYGGSPIAKEFLNTPDYKAKAVEIKQVIKSIRDGYQWKAPFKDIQDNLSTLNSELKLLKWKYTSIRENTGVTLFHFTDDWKNRIDLKIDINDLQKELDGQTFNDLLVSQKVVIPKNVTIDWKEIKAWTEIGLDDSVDPMEAKISSFMKTIEADIANFELTVPWIGDWLRVTIRNLFNGWRVDAGFLSSFKDEALKDYAAKTSVFFRDLLVKYYGSQNVSEIITPLGFELINYKKVLDTTQALPGNINLSYGGYPSNKTPWKMVNMFYVSLWKDVISWDEWRLSLKQVLEKDFKWDKWDLHIYMNANMAMIKQIAKYWTNAEWVLDFAKGLAKVRTINSINESILIIEKWKIVTKELEHIAKELWIDAKTQKEIIPFIQEMFKWANEKDSFLIRPMIYSLMDQYVTAKPILAEIFKRKWSKIKFTEAFANILIQPKLYDDMVKKMPTSEWMEKVYSAHAENSWNQFTSDLKIRIKKIDSNIEDLEASIPKQSSQYLRDAIKAQIKILELNRSSLEDISKKKTEFMENVTNMSKSNVNRKYLETQANNYALTRLLQKETPRDIPLPEMQQGRYFQIQDLLIAHYADNKWLIDQFMSEVTLVNSLEALTDLQKKYDLVPDIDDNVRTIINNILDVGFYKGDGIEFVNQDLFAKMLQRFDGSYDYDFAMENNPLSKKLSSWISWSENDRDFELEKRIVQYFEWKPSKEVIPKEIVSFEKKNLFTVVPNKKPDMLKAVSKASISTKYIGYWDWSTWMYREQVWRYANTWRYTSDDIVFTSINWSVTLDNFNKTITEVSKAIDSWATILTDNAEYTAKSSYNKWEKQLREFLSSKWIDYSEVNIDWQVIWVWNHKSKPITNKSITTKSSYELYATNADFKNMIDGLYSEKSIEIDKNTWLPLVNRKYLKSGKENEKSPFELFIDAIFKETQVKGLKKWKEVEMNADLFKDLYSDYRLLNRFKRIKNFSIKSNEKTIEFVEKEWSNPQFPEYDLILKDWEYTENILQFDNMKWQTDWKDRLKIFRNFSLTWIQKMRVWDESGWRKGYKTLKNILESKNTEKFRESLSSKDAYISSWEMYRTFVDTINFIETTDISKNALVLRKMLWLENWDVWVWNFGDKDSVYTAYQSGKDIYAKWISQWDRSKIELSLYKYEYAFANGYINPTSEITTFDGWFKEVVEPLLKDGKFSSFDDYLKKVDPKLYGGDWYEANPYILTNKQIRKREGFNMSTRNTFEDYIVDTATYVIEKKIEIVEAISNYFNGKEYVLTIEQVDEVISTNLDTNVTMVFSSLREWYGKDFNINQINKFINLLFNNDLQDGTSWISNALIRIRSEIVGWKMWLDVYSKFSEWFSGLTSEENEAVIMLRNQFKDHYYGGEKRFWAKTLFTGSKIEVDWAELHNAVVVWESSMKLEWGYTEFKKGDKWVIPEEINWKETGRFYKNITINGKPYRSFWYVPKTDTSYFKNAESDSYKNVDQVTVSDSITARLDKEYADAITEIQKTQIQDAFNEMLWELSQYKIASNSYSSVVDTIRLISSNVQLWNGSNPILSWKIKGFVSKLKQIISKPKDDWASLYIHEAALDIWLNEVLVSKESKLYKTVIEKMKNEIKLAEEKWDTTTVEKLQNDLKNWNIYTVAYRYPVPSKYNLGLYKIITVEDNAVKYDRYRNMGSDAVVSHPFNIYGKWEGDADGDGITFVPIRDWVGKVLANALLKKAPDADIEVPDTFMNDFIIAEQVDKALPTWWTEADLLIDSRSDSVWAKQFVGIIAATTRTIGLLRQMIKGEVDPNLYIPYKALYKDIDETVPVHVHFSELSSQIDPAKIEWLTKRFEQVWASNLQKAVDGEVLEKDFYVELLESILINPKDAPKVYYEFISPLSKMYGSSLLDPKKAYKIGQTKLPNNYNLDGKSNEYIALIYNSIWWRRALNDFIINEKINVGNQKMSIADFVFFMNQSKDLWFILDTIVSPSKQLKSIIDELSKPIRKGAKNIKEIKSPKESWHILKPYRKQYSDFIEAIKWPNTKAWKNIQWFLDRIKFYVEEQDIQKKQEIKWRILDVLAWDVSDDTRSIASLYALTLWEYDMFEYFSAKKKFDYLTMSDDKFVKRMLDQFWIEVPRKYIKDEDLKPLIESRLADLQIAVKEETNLDQVNFLESKIAETNSEYKNLIERTKEAELVSDPIIMESTFEVPDDKYFNILENAFSEIDRSPWSLQEFISGFSAINETSKSLFKFTTQSMFAKYAPRLMAVYNDIASFMNKKDNLVFYASKEHIRQFGSHFFGYKNSIRRQLLNAGVPDREVDSLWEIIQHRLIANTDKVFHMETDESILIKLRPEFEKRWIAKLLENVDFMKEIDSYKKNTLETVISKLNQIQEIHKYDIQAAYKNADFSLITDFMAMTNADPAFVLHINGIGKRAQFEEFIISNAAAMGLERPWDATLKTMWNIIYKDSNKMDALMNFLQWIHYQATYGTIATFFTQNSIIAWLSQILPNYVELLSYIKANPKFVDEGNYILKNYGFLASENVIRFGNMLGMKPGWFEEVVSKLTRNFVEWTARKIDGTVSKTLGKTEWSFISREAAMKSWEIVDSAVNNMLGFNDWPLEHLRKIVAVRTAMEKMGYKTLKELDEFLEFGGKDAEMMFHTYARMNFANSWGWVVSSSPFSKGTIFENSYEYMKTGILPIDLFVQFWVKSLSYLMGWSFHKAATNLEKAWALFSAINQVRLWNYKAAQSHFWDFYTQAYMITKQLALTTGLYLKFQKYERDNDNRVTLADFQKQFSNAIVSVLIPVGRHFEAFETAWKFWDKSDQFWFTINSIINHALRLFKQPQFINTMYDHYQTEDSLWRGDMLNSFQYALETHYTGSIRFTWAKASNDLFNSITQKGNLWILWLGTGVTFKDQLLKDIMSGRSFTSWKDKWFITTILSWFTGMFTGDASDISMQVMNDLVKELTDNVISKWELSKLFTGWQIGSWENDYRLASLIGEGKNITEEEKAAISALWQNIGYYDYSTLNEKWELEKYNSEWKKIEISKEQITLEKQIEKELADLNINIEDVISANPEMTPAFVKTLQVLQLKTWVKTPLILSSLMNIEYYKKRKELAEKGGQLTGQQSEYGTKYRELGINDDKKLQRDIMLKYQESFNLDNVLISRVIEADIIKNNKDLFSKFGWADNQEFIKDNIYNLAGKLRLARSAMYNNDTKVAALTTQYSLIFKWIKDTETWAKVILQALRDVEANPNMDAKMKLANQAAMLSSLNKTQLNLLKDNKEFEKLTEWSRKELTNWLYKVSSDTIDFDSNSYMNKLNESSWSRWATRRSSYVKTLPKPQSSSFGWARPNFSNQFSPIRDFIPGKEGYLSTDPNAFLSSRPSYLPRSVEWFNPNNSRMMQEYMKIMITGLFYGYESKGTIRTGSTDKKFDKNQNTSIKIAKPKKAKSTKEFKKFKPTPKVSMWMRPDLPLANYWD